MIKLEKTDEPDILSQNKEEWTNLLLDYIEADEKVPKSLSTKYNKDEIKESLRIESSGKCIYCESKVNHITYEHIEHIKPKAKNQFPELTYEYENLGLACPKCNMNKGAKFDETVPFINPYQDDPDKHFNAYGAFIWAKSGDKRAKITENEIELNRPELLEIRQERLKKIRSLIDIHNSETNDTVKRSLKKQILKEVNENKPYSFITEKIVKNLLRE